MPSTFFLQDYTSQMPNLQVIYTIKLQYNRLYLEFQVNASYQGCLTMVKLGGAPIVALGMYLWYIQYRARFVVTYVLVLKKSICSYPFDYMVLFVIQFPTRLHESNAKFLT